MNFTTLLALLLVIGQFSFANSNHPSLSDDMMYSYDVNSAILIEKSTDKDQCRWGIAFTEAEITQAMKQQIKSDVRKQLSSINMQFLEHFYQDPALNIKMNYNNSRFYFPFDNENNRPSYTTSNTGDDLVFHNLYKVQSMALATIPNTIIPISIEIALDIYYVADVTFVPTFAKKTKSDVIEQQIKGQCIYTSNYNSYVDIFNSKNRKILSRSQLR